jgi:cbb3-type cytochrome oxidase maturation protein
VQAPNVSNQPQLNRKLLPESLKPMDILYLLVPMSAVLLLGIVGIFAWAVHSGQLEDLEGEGARALQGEDSNAA